MRRLFNINWDNCLIVILGLFFIEYYDFHPVSDLNTNRQVSDITNVFLRERYRPQIEPCSQKFLKTSLLLLSDSETVPNYLKKCVDFVKNIVSNPWKYQTVWRVESSQRVNLKLVKYYMASTCFSYRIWRLNLLISTTLAIQLIFELDFYFGICLDVYCATKF